MDSKLVVEQMSGRWQVKHPDLQPLHAEGRRAGGGVAAVTFDWIPRERNTYADRLANEAMDAAAGGRVWTARSEAAPRPDPAEAAGAPKGDDGYLADTSAPTRMVLVRHGSTELSGLRYSGRVDPELTAKGLAQAQALAAPAGPRSPAERPVVVSSPLQRAVATADRDRRRARRRGAHRRRPAGDRLRRVGGPHVRRGQAALEGRAQGLADRQLGRPARRRERRRRWPGGCGGRGTGWSPRTRAAPWSWSPT